MCDTTNHIRDVADAIHQCGFTYLGAGHPSTTFIHASNPRWNGKEDQLVLVKIAAFFAGYLKHKLLNMIVDS